MKKILLLNAAKIDFDRRLDFGPLSAHGEVTTHADSRPEEVPGRAAGQQVLITKELPLGAEQILTLPPSVELICEAGTGYNNIDLAAARQRGIAVCNVPGYSTEAVAQLVITFILNFSCSLVRQQRMVQRGDFANFTDALQVPHFELQGKTLGLVGGSGAIGKQVMAVALVLGMKVLVHSRTPRTWEHPEVRSARLEELLSRSDFVSLHCPLTAETRHLIDRERLALMKPSAYLINTARGPIINEADLIEALRRGVLAGAALDVQDPEPPALDTPLFAMDNVILTPHIGWQRLETRQRLLQAVADNIRAFSRGTPVNLVG